MLMSATNSAQAYAMTPVDLAQMQAQDAARTSAVTGEAQSLFADQLDSVESALNQKAQSSDEAMIAAQPKPQKLSSWFSSPTVEKETTPSTEKEIKTTKQQEIARSYHMESANETTKVNEVSMDWGDVIDFINPLQHIPLVATAYRELTGDEIKPAIKIAGDIAYGVATGSLAVSAVASIASSIYEEHTGEETTVQIAQALWGDENVVGGPSASAGKVLTTAETQEGNVSMQTAMATLSSPAASFQQTVAAANQVKAARSADQVGSTVQRHQSGMMRVGDKLYPKKAYATHTVAEKSESAPTAEVQTTAVTPNNIGQMMQKQAEAKAAGEPLPTGLVQDMMLMALDKYKTAQSMGAGTTSTVQ